MAPVAKVDITSFVKNQLALLELERNTEILETSNSRKCGNVKELEKLGICVTKLHVTSECTGLYGKHLVSFGRGNGKRTEGKGNVDSNRQLRSNCLSNGDVIGVQRNADDIKEPNMASGIVTRVTDDIITVAFEEDFEISSSKETFKLIKLFNDITYKRLKSALENLNNTSRRSRLKDVLFHQSPLGECLQLVKEDKFCLLDTTLNDCQTEAVKFALNQKEIGVIHGPPGTGKTTTIIEIIRQAVEHFNFKVLACAPSNVATDNLVAKLADAKLKIVRLGHPARVYPNLQKHSLDAVLMRSDSAEIIKNVRDDIQTILRKISKTRSSQDKRCMWKELKCLKNELFKRELKTMKAVLSSADVILSTTTTASSEGPLKHLGHDHFDLVVIDEAAQALEASCWIPLMHGSRCILAGDHRQLPPTILSHKAAKNGLETTLMERAIEEFGNSIVKMLTTQYRMNKLIMTWPSQQLYNGKLTADESVSSHLLSDLHQVVADENTSLPLLFIDTSGCCMYELQHESEESKGNENEVELVVHHIEALVNAGVKQEAIGVITPYNLQVELLRQALSAAYPKLEIRSVDGFQGREKEAIVISLVRSNDQGEVGFLKEDRRLNVAITRARCHLAVIGDSTTICSHPFLKSFFDYVTDHGEVRSAQSYVLGSTGPNREVAGDDLLKDFEVMVKRNNEERQRDMKKVSYAKDDSNGSTSQSGTEEKEAGVSDASINEVNEERKKGFEFDECKIGAVENVIERKEYKKEDIEKLVAEFIDAGKKETLEFDSSLGKKERFWVHELAEKYGLAHWSVGDGKDRCISINKKREDRSKLMNSFQHKDMAVQDEVRDEPNMCRTCDKSVPKHNMELHALRCSKIEDCEGGAREQMHRVRRKNLKKKAQAKIDKKEKKNKEEEDVDEVIAQFSKVDSICRFEKCKTSVLTLGQRCEFCTRMYCIRHSLAEVHGCGKAAKLNAKRTFQSNAGKVKIKPLNEMQKKCAKMKLDKKINEMEKKRNGSGEKNR